MVADLAAGANIALPAPSLSVVLEGPFDLSALVVGASGLVGGDADMVFYNQPDAPGVRLRGRRLTITPGDLRRGGERVVVVVSPDEDGRPVGALPPVLLGDGRERPLARFAVPPMRTETVAVVVEVYRRGAGWRVRAVGQGYADGLAGLARDYGVDVAEEGPLDDVVTLTNAERARHGLRPLAADARLARAAQEHSADMVARGFFAHESPDGRQVWDRATAAGYAYRKVAENIAAGQRTAAEVVAGWMASPGHRRNILDGELTQIGVGRADGGAYGVYWTQVFGAPRQGTRGP